jgi:hypothetical protein
MPIFTAEFAENAEKKNLDNLCALSDLCGEILFGTVSDFMMFHTSPAAGLTSETFWKSKYK